MGTRPKTPECQELTSLDDYVTADEVRLEETKSITSANISPSQSNASNLYDNVESSPWEYPDVSECTSFVYIQIYVLYIMLNNSVLLFIYNCI